MLRIKLIRARSSRISNKTDQQDIKENYNWYLTFDLGFLKSPVTNVLESLYRIGHMKWSNIA